MSLPIAIILILVGLAVLIVGADALVLGAAQLAKRLGLSPFAIGVTVVAFGTSAPELFASVGAALQNVTDLAIGNVVGSNIANIILILGVSALVSTIPINRRVRFVEIPIMVAITALTTILLIDHELARLEGALLVVGLLAFVLYVVKSHKEDILHEADDKIHNPKPLWIDLVYITAGVAGLALGAKVLVEGAQSVAISAGVPEGVVGATIVAFGTSVPELVTTIRAAVKKHTDMAVGNIVGSNIFNLLSVLGITSLIKPLTMDTQMDFHVLFMLGVALGFMIWTLLRPRIAKPGAILFLLLYTGYVVYAYSPQSA